MKEVYVGDTDNAELRIYASGGRAESVSPVTATLYDANGVELETGTATAVTEDSGTVYTFPIDSTYTQDETTLSVQWDFEPVSGVTQSQHDHIEVVTPYVRIHQIRTEFPVLASRTDDQLRHLERVVRYTINQFCGQSFGISRAHTYMVQGSGDHSLFLPRRLVSVSGVMGGGLNITPYMSIGQAGWMLAFPPYSGMYVDVKADIGLVGSPRLYFDSRYQYAITGDWGWLYVPSEIQQAASILVGRYMEPEQNWRRYNADVITASDWRIEINRASRETTGDADVDLMIQRYKAPFFGVL